MKHASPSSLRTYTIRRRILVAVAGAVLLTAGMALIADPPDPTPGVTTTTGQEP
jgi:hypothetical protein